MISAFFECNNLTTVYYKGSEEEKDNIIIDSENECFTNATVYYYSGKCGDNLTWEFDGIDTLTISGTGKMYDFYSEAYPKASPWHVYWNDIKEIKIIYLIISF